MAHELSLSAFQCHRIERPHQRRRHFHEIGCCDDSPRLERHRQPASYAPNVLDGRAPQDDVDGLRANEPIHAVGDAAVALGDVVGDLGQGAAWCESDADGNAHVLAYFLHQLGHDTVARLHVLVRQDKKCLVNRILLQVLDLLGHDAHHAVGQVTVQDVAARQLDDVAGVGIFPDFEGRTSHGNASGLGFVAAGNDATVVVGKDNDFLPVESRVKHPFTGYKEIIAVNQAVHICSLRV